MKNSILLVVFLINTAAFAKADYNCTFEVWTLFNGKPKTPAPNFKKTAPLIIENKIIGDGSGKNQGLHIKGEGFIAHALALRLPDAKNGSWEDLQLQIFKDDKEIYPRSLAHVDLNSKKGMISLLTKEKSLSFTCEKI